MVADLVRGAGRTGAAPAGAVSALGQGQADRAVAARGLGGVGLDGAKDPDFPPPARRAERAHAVSGERRRRTEHRPWALRNPKDYPVEKPGNLVQLDIIDLRPTAGIILKQFRARNMITRCSVIEVRSRSTSSAPALFSDTFTEPPALSVARSAGG